MTPPLIEQAIPSRQNGVALNKVVVAYLDGRRVHGTVYDFSPLKETFRLVQGDSLHKKTTEISLKDLKDVFFVKDFRGNSKYKESQKIAEGKPGRQVEGSLFAVGKVL